MHVVYAYYYENKIKTNKNIYVCIYKYIHNKIMRNILKLMYQVGNFWLFREREDWRNRSRKIEFFCVIFLSQSYNKRYF